MDRECWGLFNNPIVSRWSLTSFTWSSCFSNFSRVIPYIFPSTQTCNLMNISHIIKIHHKTADIYFDLSRLHIVWKTSVSKNKAMMVGRVTYIKYEAIINKQFPSLVGKSYHWWCLAKKQTSFHPCDFDAIREWQLTMTWLWFIKVRFQRLIKKCYFGYQFTQSWCWIN